MSSATNPGQAGPTLPALRVLADPDAVSTAAGAAIAATLAAAIAERGVAHWATTGGSAAPDMYRALLRPDVRASVDWTSVHTWWGDDRFVPEADPLSNVLPYRRIVEAEAGLVLPEGHVHPIRVAQTLAAGGGPAEAAAAYARELAAVAWSGTDGVPILDLVVLGVGPDGHVLSVFPGSAAWDEEANVVAIPAPTHIEPHVPRVTVHPRVVAAARAVLVVAAGASKAGNIGRAWEGGDVRELPLRMTRLATATWLLDEAAAAQLPGR